MILTTLRRWGDMWRVRRFWKSRLAMFVASVGAFVWIWFGGADLTNRTDKYVFMVAVVVPTVVNLVFWQSDAHAERERKARLRHRTGEPLPKYDVYTGERLR